MRSDSHHDDSVYRNCVTWNVPAIRRADNRDAIEFVDTLRLRAGGNRGDNDRTPDTRVSPLRRASLGLRAELSGDPELALEHYRKISRLPGVRGLLGQLLIAWMTDATPADFERVEARLRGLGGPGVRDLTARVHCRLAGWSLDHGWSDLAHHHFELAQRSAGKELGFQLGEIGHWFGTNRYIHFRAKRGNTIRFPWILDFVDDAARMSVESQFKESFKSPWTRTWTVGAASVEGTEIQSAEMQASWAGALWLMPTIQRQHAAHILNKSSDPTDISRAIALWVRGGGSNADRLIGAYEGHLTAEAVSNLLVDQLHAGRSVTNSSTWLEACRSLWSEMPEHLVDSMVEEYPGPAEDIRSHGDAASELTLFARLLSRSPSAERVVEGLADAQLGLLLRVATAELLGLLSEDSLLRGLTAALSDENDEWKSTGWSELAFAWTLLPPGDRDELRQLFVERTPEWLVAIVAAVAKELFPSKYLRRQLDREIASAQQDITDAAKGMFTGRSVEPATSIAWLTYRTGSRHELAETVLIRLATDRRVDAHQRQAALDSLTMLAREGLLDEEKVSAAFGPVKQVSWVRMTDDPATDQRYEDLLRAVLQVSFGYDSSFDGILLSGSRDPNTRVRHLAVDTARWLSLQGKASPAVDAALLGALYDPHPSVQAVAVPALWRGEFTSRALREAAQRRVVELWPTAPLELRRVIAREAREPEFAEDEVVRYLAERCRSDRSVLVRRAIDGSDD